MAKLKIPIEVKLDDFKAVIEEIKNLQTYKLYEDDDMVLVDRGKVADVLANHVEAFLNDKPYCDEPPKTNADRLRNMPDEKLAELIAQYVDCEVCPVRGKSRNGICHNHDCTNAILDYLREVKECKA